MASTSLGAKIGVSNTPKPSKCIENYAISTFAAAVGVHLGLKRLPTQSEIIYCGIFYIARRKKTKKKHIFPIFWLGGQDTCLGGLCPPLPPSRFGPECAGVHPLSVCDALMPSAWPEYRLEMCTQSVCLWTITHNEYYTKLFLLLPIDLNARS